MAHFLCRAPVVAFSALLMVSPIAAAAAAADKPSDPFCPEAIAKVEAVVAAGKTNNPVALADAARAARDTYMHCASDARFTGTIEPQAHYDDTRAAQMAFLAGRALVVAGRTDEGVKLLQESRKLSDSVVTWVPPPLIDHVSNVRGQSWTEAGADRRPSKLHDAALAIRDAATTELAKLLPGAPAPNPSPSP